MTVYLCSTQPDIFRFLANKIEKLGHFCLLFSDYTNLTNTLLNSKTLPDLVLLDYKVENHILTTNPYENLDAKKIYLPLIYYNDPCIAKGARVSVWKNIIENFCNKEYAPQDKQLPDMQTMEELLNLVSDFVESKEFSPYIYLMQEPKPFPKDFSTDALLEKLKYDKNHYFNIEDFKQTAKLPENLFVLLQIFYDHKDDFISLSALKSFYSEKKGELSEESLKVHISQLKSRLKKFTDFNYSIEHSPKGYKFSIR